MATHMTENEIQKLREMFIKIDEDKDGKISAEELYEYMNAMKALDPSVVSDGSNSKLDDLKKVQAFIQEAD
jgi:Ca2+-binding EF-hand superfamily protein